MEKRDSRNRRLYDGEDQMPDGRYRYRYNDAKTGGRKAIYSWRLVITDKTPTGKRDKEPLREQEKKIKRDVEDGISSYDAKNLDVKTAIRRYLSTNSKIIEITRLNYINMCEVNIDPIIGSKKIADIKKSDIKNFYSYLYKEKNFAASTLKLYQNLLYPTFQMLVEDSIIRLNPCSGCMKDFSSNSMQSEKFALTRTEQSELMTFLKHDVVYKHRYYAITAVMLGAGLRICECLGLTWDNIDFDRKEITVDHQLRYEKVNGKCIHVIKQPKPKRIRVIPIQQSLLDILEKYRDDNIMRSLDSGLELDGYTGFVFLNSKDKFFKPDTVNRAYDFIVRKYNKEEEANAYDEEREPHYIRRFTPHELRHTYCTRMAENGMDVKVLQEIMGHVNIQVTMQIYTHISNDRINNEVMRVSDVLI